MILTDPKFVMIVCTSVKTGLLIWQKRPVDKFGSCPALYGQESGADCPIDGEGGGGGGADRGTGAPHTHTYSLTHCSMER